MIRWRPEVGLSRKATSKFVASDGCLVDVLFLHWMDEKRTIHCPHTQTLQTLLHPKHDFIGTTVVRFRNVFWKPSTRISMRPYFLVGIGRVGEDCHALVFRGSYLQDRPNHGDRKSPKWGCSPSKWPEWVVNGGY